MTGWEAARIYQSIHLHFTSKKWGINWLKQGMLVKLSYEAYIKKQNYKVFENWSNKISRADWFGLIVANELYGCTNYLYDNESAKHNLNVWNGVKERISYILNNDLESLKSTKFLMNPSLIVQRMIQGLIRVESAVAFNKLENYTNLIRGGKNYSPIIEPLLLRLDRGVVFVKVPSEIEEKYRNFIKSSQPVD